MMDNALRRIFRLLNKYFMVPVFQLGLGVLVGNPFSGYIMVIKTIGHKSGKTRFAPVNYAIIDGQVYIMAGFGRVTHWFKNLQANPNLDVILPGRTISGQAVEVDDPQEALIAVRQILRNAGFAGFFEGYNPRRASDEQLQATLTRAPIIRIQPSGVHASLADPGGWLWWGLTLAALVLLFILLR